MAGIVLKQRTTEVSTDSTTHQKVALKKTTLAYIYIVAGVLGGIAAFALTYDKIQLLQNPSYIPGCNINPIFSCGSVMNTEQASLLGVPNTVFGLMAFSSLATLGFLLAAGAQLKRWLWILVQVAAAVGVLFMHYLFFQGVYRINAICPWCFTVWMITIPVFWYTTLYNLREKNIALPSSTRGLGKFMQDNHANILLVWYLTIFGILLTHFWYYWSTLL